MGYAPKAVGNARKPNTLTKHEIVWRIVFEKERNFPGANLKREILRGVDLSSGNLAGADLQHAKLEGSNLSGASLRNANLSFANLESATFKSKGRVVTNLARSDLSLAVLYGAKLSEADLTEANLEGANLRDANLASVTASGANFNGANLRNAVLSGDFQRSTFRYATVDPSFYDLRGILAPDLEDAVLPDGSIGKPKYSLFSLLLAKLRFQAIMETRQGLPALSTPGWAEHIRANLVLTIAKEMEDSLKRKRSKKAARVAHKNLEWQLEYFKTPRIEKLVAAYRDEYVELASEIKEALKS